MSITQLALANPARSVADLAERFGRRLVAVSPETDQEEAHRIIARYSMSIVPVVDDDQRVLGVIRAEEAMYVGEEEVAEDMLRIASAPGRTCLRSIASFRSSPAAVAGGQFGDRAGRRRGGEP